MEPQEFDRRLEAWLDGELPEPESAEMAAAAKASPQLGERADLVRAFDARVIGAMQSDAAGDAGTIRAMLAKARPHDVGVPVAAPAGRMFAFPRGAWRAAAASLVLGVTGMWWFCIPPFECSYMQALERAGHADAEPGPRAEELAKQYGLPERIETAVAAHPVAHVCVDFWSRHCEGVRMDYVRPDGSAFHVIACDSAGVRPSLRRRTDRDGASWWIGDMGCCHVVAFDVAGSDRLYAVTGGGDDESVLKAAESLRAAIR